LKHFKLKKLVRKAIGRHKSSLSTTADSNNGNMDFLKITKVENVTLEKGQATTIGTLHLTTHQMIFRQPCQKDEIWIPYPIIHTVERRSSTTDP
ncbi:10033_t:CDS:2, partial [Racocetra persica]